MNDIELWSRLRKIERAKAALEKHGFTTVVVRTGEEAAAFVMSCIGPEMRLGFGGSMTIKDLDISEKARQAGATVLDHNRPGISPEEKLVVLRAQLTCDLFICSANAVTLTGELLNIDGNGNRVAAMTFGPKRNIVVAGANKLVADEAMDAAQCVGCGACAATCPNGSAMLFVAAKVSQLALLPQGRTERRQRVLDMVAQMDREGFGSCSNTYACEAKCPKRISVSHIARMNREYLRAGFKS